MTCTISIFKMRVIAIANVCEWLVDGHLPVIKNCGVILANWRHMCLGVPTRPRSSQSNQPLRS